MKKQNDKEPLKYPFTHRRSSPGSHSQEDLSHSVIIRPEATSFHTTDGFASLAAPTSTDITPPIRMGRRLSIHEQILSNKQFLVDVESTKKMLLEQEDMDKDSQITIEDKGPRKIKLGTLSSLGHQKKEIQGTYSLANLLQELTLAEDQKYQKVVISEELLRENPVQRLRRMIQWWFWPALVRRLDSQGLMAALQDPKISISDNIPYTKRIYVPLTDPMAYLYYSQIQGIEVHRLPDVITEEVLLDLREKPGMLSLALVLKSDLLPSNTDSLSTSSFAPSHHHYTIGPTASPLVGCNEAITHTLEPLPFVVPGGRFNEMYGWDSYFIILGLLCSSVTVSGGPQHPIPSLADHHHVSQYDAIGLCKSIVENFKYQIDHYGMILNANRTYYLGRSQPPFFTDMIRLVYARLVSDGAFPTIEEGLCWLGEMLCSAMKEYTQVWMKEPRYVPSIGLSRYYPMGKKIPPETEPHHYDAVLAVYAAKHGYSKDRLYEFQHEYQNGSINDDALDEYFLHDRAVRESGHDTCYRLDGCAANLCTIDLNALLYKYETDIADILETWFPNGLPEYCHVSIQTCDTELSSSNWWREKAKKRKEMIYKYCWDESSQFFYDYNIATGSRSDYESVTAYWTLWAGLIEPEHAEILVMKQLSKFEEPGGLVCGTKSSLSRITSGPKRQWDYPFGWPPHQILAWEGLRKYHYDSISRRLAYRWLYMMTKAFVDYNGVVPEKFDVVLSSHKVSVEYGNVGIDFKYIPREGFGWMNSSYMIGLGMLTERDLRALAALVPPDKHFASKQVK